MKQPVLHHVSVTLALGAGVLAMSAWAGWTAGGVARPVPIQMPFEAPPQPETAPDTSVAPGTRPLSEEEFKRAEALLPMLDGKQELWAIGEFVHLGPGAVPVLVKALNMPSTRAKYNAIETLSMIKDPAAVPALVDTAKQPQESSRVREHALRVAVRLDPPQVVPAIDVMAKDPNSTIRKAAAFEARYVRHKSVVPILIGLLPDPESFVAISAIQSLWILTRHPSEMHDWESSTKEQRVEWAQEWADWWKQAEATFEFPPPRKPKLLPPN